MIAPAAAQNQEALAAAGRCQAAQRGEPQREPGEILLQADSMSYDVASGVVTAEGHIEAAFHSCVLTADHIEYDQKNNIVRASGDIAIMEPSGNVVFAKSLELSGGLEQGIVSSFSAILAGNSRLAAANARRKPGDITELDHVVYSPCQICNKPGFEPLWQIKALKVTHDENRKVITYKSVMMEVKGVPVLYLPYFSHADPSVKRKSGFLIPSFGNSTDLGNYIEIPYFLNLRPNEDVTFNPLFTSDASTAWKAQYRRRTGRGSYSIDGSLAFADINSTDPANPTKQATRSHLFGNGRFRLSDVWSYGFDAQLTSDDTYLKRYEISNLDRLTTRVFAEGFANRDHANVSAYYFQGLRQQDDPATTPLILPLAELTWYPHVKALGGTVRVDGNLLALARHEGIDSNRVSVTAHWQRQAVTPSGHVFKLFAETRGDVYYTNGLNPTNDPSLPDNSKVTARALPTIGLEWRWPLARSGARRYQVIEPIAQVIWSPYGGNPIDIPNEDSSSFEFDDTNLFRSNKLPGYDLVESGPRANVGLRYAVFGGEGEQMEFLFGQSFRLKQDSVFAPSTGLGDTRSDYVGRLRLAPNKYVELTHRFRIDKDNLAFNRNEVIGRFGPDNYWARISYLQLAEQLSDTGQEKREEIEGQAHLKIFGNWSIEGETRRDLANSKMITSGLALIFSNECTQIEFAYKRRFTRDREIEPSSTFNIKLRLKTFGETTSR